MVYYYTVFLCSFFQSPEGGFGPTQAYFHLGNEKERLDFEPYKSPFNFTPKSDVLAKSDLGGDLGNNKKTRARSSMVSNLRRFWTFNS